MLNALKSIINSKLTFLETADLILEEMDDADIMDDIIDDEIANGSDEIADGSDEIPAEVPEETSSDSISPEEEDEAIYTFGLDTRSGNLNDTILSDFKITVSSGFDDIKEDVDNYQMDGFLDESFTFNSIDYSKYIYEGVSIADMCYTEDVGDEIPPIDDGNSGDANAGGSTPPPNNSAPEETAVTTAVKEELKDSDETPSDDNPPPPDSPETPEPPSMNSGVSKIETGRQIMKQLKKAEDITFDYFFNDET